MRSLFIPLLLIIAHVAGAQTAPDSVRRDSVQAARARRDSLARRDSVAAKDSAAARDTLKTAKDSTAKDSLVTADSSAARDSITADSTKARRDSTPTTDSSVVVKESLPVRDSVAVIEPEPRVVPPVNVRLPTGRTLKDSLELAKTLRAGLMNPGWPVRMPPPLPGSVLPAKRIVAFYGTPLSKRMGVLGQYPMDHMLAKLDSVCAEWRDADPATPVQPALHFIAVVAQAGPGKDGKYRLRMDSALIEKVYGWAHERGALLFLDIQAGHSTIVDELPRLAKFLERPDVHLGVDPEFNMRYLPDSVAPGKQIGSVRAAEINETVAFLSKLTVEKKLPPKVLVIHRFRTPMVRNTQDIKLDPRVQIVMHMDGWGIPSIKYGSYNEYVVKEPVQFTGFKLFYKQDTQYGDKLLTPTEILQLYPRPVYIQYQ